MKLLLTMLRLLTVFGVGVSALPVVGPAATQTTWQQAIR